MHNINDGSLLINTVMNDTQKPPVVFFKIFDFFCYDHTIFNIQATVYLQLVLMKYILAKDNIKASKILGNSQIL